MPEPETKPIVPITVEVHANDIDISIAIRSPPELAEIFRRGIAAFGQGFATGAGSATAHAVASAMPAPAPEVPPNLREYAAGLAGQVVGWVEIAKTDEIDDVAASFALIFDALVRRGVDVSKLVPS